MLKTVLIALALLPALPFALAAETVTVTLEVDVLGNDHKSCEVAVPAGSNAGAVLDAAVDQGCLLRWTSQEYPGFGRYVDCIDLLCGAVATYWAFYANGGYSDVGIDAYPVAEADVLRFNYEQWVVIL
jgi:hypothetical protein